jgi:hypothetical protein
MQRGVRPAAMRMLDDVALDDVHSTTLQWCCVRYAPGMAWLTRAAVDNAGELGVVACAMEPLILPITVAPRLSRCPRSPRGGAAAA